jgi:hypothetical protein
MASTEHVGPRIQDRRSPRGAASLGSKWTAGGGASTSVRLPPSTPAGRKAGLDVESPALATVSADSQKHFEHTAGGPGAGSDPLCRAT